jgi:hypothetical protein
MDISQRTFRWTAPRIAWAALVVAGWCAAMLLFGARGADASAAIRLAPAAPAGPCDGTIDFGEVVSCDIKHAGDMQSLSFPGTTGHILRLRVAVTAGSLGPYADVRRPNQSVVCGPTQIDEFACTLDANGTHTLNVRDVSGTNTGTFAVTIQDLTAPVGCATASFGETGKTGAIAKPVEMDCFTRSGGNAGDHWRIRLVETSGSLQAMIELLHADGTTACANTFATDVTCSIDVAGTYTLLVRDGSGGYLSTGDYRVVFQKFPNPTGCTALTLGGAAVADAMDVPGDMDCFTFNGKSGNLIHLKVILTGGTWSPYAEVLRPDGTTVCAPTQVDEFDCALDVDGKHVLLVRDTSGPNVGTYTVQAAKV